MNVNEVFVPTGYPKHTYVQRADHLLEGRLQDALATNNAPISISGPSKTGKTALVKKSVSEENLIHIFGRQVGEGSPIWKVIWDKLGLPSSRSSLVVANENTKANTTLSAGFNVPGFASFAATTGAGKDVGSSQSINQNYASIGLSEVAREIANSDFVVFVDDFHYIPRDMQRQVAQDIKIGVESGIRFCVASVPHRSDDMVRSNHELRGRTVNIDSSFWSKAELEQIATLGFGHLNVQVPCEIIELLAEESCTSPQIMQALCLEMCRSKGIRDRQEQLVVLGISQEEVKSILASVAENSNHRTLVKNMHSGPKPRGSERKVFRFHDGSVGDVYRACLLALAADPPILEFAYSNILDRIQRLCIDDSPSGGSVTGSLRQISEIASPKDDSPQIVEWDDDTGSGVFVIIDPYFLSYIRSSKFLADAVNGKTG